MTSYYLIDLSANPFVVVGSATLPPELVRLTDEALADLSWVGEPLSEVYAGRGYWPAVRVAPTWDPATQRLSGQVETTLDVVGRRVVETPLVVNLAPAEAYAAALSACHEARRAAYPPVGDQLDAIAKAVAALGSSGTTLPPEVQAWLDAIAAVKAAHPKPPGPG